MGRRIGLLLFLCAATFACADDQPIETPAEVFRVTGLSRPESFIADPHGDSYFISNVSGEPMNKDGDGFITRLKGDGTVDALRWAPAPQPMPTLHAPTGLAIYVPATEDQRAPITRYLVIADIDRLVLVEVNGAQPAQTIDFSGLGAEFLNDVTIDQNTGRIFVTDMMAKCIFTVLPRYAGDKEPAKPEKWLELGEINPNGLVLQGTGAAQQVTFVSWGPGELRQIPVTAKALPAAVAWPAPAPENLENLDGVFVAPDQTTYFSSYSGGTIHAYEPGKALRVVVQGLTTPADIGFDAKRGLLLVPLMEADEAVAFKLPAR